MTVSPSITSWFPLDNSDVPKTSFRAWAESVENKLTNVFRSGANTGFGITNPAHRLDVAGGDINVASGQAYRYNGVNVIRAVTGTFNYFFGPAGNLTVSGVSNVALGESAALALTSGQENLAIGTNSLRNTTSGIRNVALGSGALFSNTVGNGNLAIGSAALFLSTTASNNVAIGFNTGVNVTTGSTNTLIGDNAATGLTLGNSNTIIGRNTAISITDGSNNTIIGANVIGLAASLSNNIILADGAGNRRINVGASGDVGIGATDPQTRLDVNGAIRKRQTFTVATLPAASLGDGIETYVSDSNATLAAGHGNVVAGGGANYVPVYSSGGQWRIG